MEKIISSLKNCKRRKRQPFNQHKQRDSAPQCIAASTFGVAGRRLKRPHSIKDDRRGAVGHSVFSSRTNNSSNDPAAQMFSGSGGGLINSKYLTKKSVSVWFEGLTG